MARRNEYTGEQCSRGHPLYVRVVTGASRPESRRGPSCWHDECPTHREWQASVKQRTDKS